MCLIFPFVAALRQFQAQRAQCAVTTPSTMSRYFSTFLSSAAYASSQIFRIILTHPAGENTNNLKNQ